VLTGACECRLCLQWHVSWESGGWCRHMKVEGRVTFNGQKLSKRLKRQIGYVMQAS